MAKLLSHIASSIRGSVGGITYTAGRNHAIQARVRVGPARLGTNIGNTVRTSLEAAIAIWNNLSVADQLIWDQYALTVTFSGPLGTYKITGRQMFIRTLVPAIYYNTTLSTTFGVTGDPPLLPGLPNIGPIVEASIATIGTGIAVSVENTCGFDATALLTVSIPWTNSRKKDPNIWDTSKNSVVTCANGVATLVEVLNLVEDMYYFLKVRMILDDEPLRIDTEYVFRLQAETVAV